jgi:hypothetical protein
LLSIYTSLGRLTFLCMLFTTSSSDPLGPAPSIWSGLY